MSSFAMSLSGIIPPPPTNKIFFMCNEPKMVWITARRIFTNQMVKYLIIRKWFYQPRINKTMNKQRRRRYISNRSKAIPTIVSSTLPLPATAVITNQNFLKQDTNGTRF